MLALSVRAKLWLLLLVSLALAVILARQMPFIYGPSYWKWHARYIPACRYFPAMLVAAVPLFAAVFIHGEGRARTLISILLTMFSMLLMQIVHIGMTVSPFGLSRIIYFVESPMSTSYFADALRSMDHPTLELL